MSIKQGEYLKKLRTEKGLSQDALGEVLGISRQSVSKWEQGNSTPDIDNIGKLAEFYGVSIDSLVKGEAQEEAENTTAESEEEKAVNELIDEFTGKAENEEKEEQQETQLSAPQPSLKEKESERKEKRKRKEEAGCFRRIPCWQLLHIA